MIIKFNKQVWFLALSIVLLGLFIVPSTGVGQNQVEFVVIGENLQTDDARKVDYAEILSNDLRGMSPNLEISDLTSSNVHLERLQRWIATDDGVQRQLQHPELLVVTIGYSDLFNHLQSGQTTLEEFKQTYNQRLDNLLQSVQKNTKAQVVIGDLYNPYPLKHPHWSKTEALVKELNAELYDRAWKYNVAVAPVYETFAEGAKGKSHTFVSNYYPNSTGQQALAGAFYRLAKKTKFN